MRTAPWHFWVVGILALLWNAMGAWDYYASNMALPAYVEMMTPEQIAFFDAMPAWATGTWAIAVWGGLIGAVMLLARSALAAPIFLISFAAMILTTIQNFLLSDIPMSDIMPPGAAIFSVVIFLVALFLVQYTYRQKRKGRLR